MLGYLESSRGNSANAIADWRKAVELNPSNYRAAYQLAEEVERQAGPNSDAEYRQLIQKILAAQPDNLAAQLELVRMAAKSGDADTLKSESGENHCALRELAARSESATRSPANRRRRSKPQASRDANHIPAQHPDARSGISRESRRLESARGRRSRTIHRISPSCAAGFSPAPRIRALAFRCDSRWPMRDTACNGIGSAPFRLEVPVLR